MPNHRLPPTSHTVELNQLVELNARLSAIGSQQPITAGELGLAGSTPQSDVSAATLPASAALVRLSWEGPPEYPYIHGIFTTTPGVEGEAFVVEVHTAALVQLSHRLHLHQRWGV